MSDVNVVTLVITKQTKIENVDKLIEGLCSNVDKEKTLVIASVDFSHYLDLDNAEQMDLITMDTIENKDINKIMTFDNKYLDSPISIVTLLKFMDKLNAGNIQLLNHSNTELIMQTKMEETTSYLTYLFY
jgi:AmmeMemoRadiSam system protein B